MCCEKLSCHCVFVTAFFLGVMKLLNLKGVKSRGIFTKVFRSVFLLHIKAFFAKMVLRGELKCLKDSAIFTFANQIHPYRFLWHDASNKFGQECLRNYLSFDPKDIGAYNIYQVSDNEECKPRGHVDYWVQYLLDLVLKCTVLIKLLVLRWSLN